MALYIVIRRYDQEFSGNNKDSHEDCAGDNGNEEHVHMLADEVGGGIVGKRREVVVVASRRGLARPDHFILFHDLFLYETLYYRKVFIRQFIYMRLTPIH